MKTDPIFTMPSPFDDAYEILTQSRGLGRRMTYHLIIIETLRAISGGKPTKDQLQRYCKIRRKKFIAVLKFLIETESVIRSGTGTRFNPFRFKLGPKEIRS